MKELNEESAKHLNVFSKPNTIRMVNTDLQNNLKFGALKPNIFNKAITHHNIKELSNHLKDNTLYWLKTYENSLDYDIDYIFVVKEFEKLYYIKISDFYGTEMIARSDRLNERKVYDLVIRNISLRHAIDVVTL